MLIATSINGVISGLFSGQPLMIFGATGPFLVFEEMLYNVNLIFLKINLNNLKKYWINRITSFDNELNLIESFTKNA